jgi:hypothetical protein
MPLMGHHASRRTVASVEPAVVHSRGSRVGLGALLVLLAFGLPAQAARGATSNVIRVQGGYVTRLGPWNAKRDSSLGAAIHVFGSPSTVRADGPGECRAYWTARRISATFHYRDEDQRFRTHCGPVGRLDWFIAGDTSWRTSRGLRVGAPTSRIRRIHPAADLTSKGLWELTTEPEFGGPTTVAEPHGGLVKSLRAWFIED